MTVHGVPGAPNIDEYLGCPGNFDILQRNREVHCESTVSFMNLVGSWSRESRRLETHNEPLDARQFRQWQREQLAENLCVGRERVIAPQLQAPLMCSEKRVEEAMKNMSRRARTAGGD